MIYDDFGRRLSVIDGYWVIQFGQTGWLGYLAFFGILTAPFFYMRRLYRDREDLPIAMAGLIMIATANLIYMIPNATLTPVNMLVFGTLAAFVNFETIKGSSITRSEIHSEASRNSNIRYSRFTDGASARQYRRLKKDDKDASHVQLH